MKQTAVILAVILAGIGLNGCGSRDIGPHDKVGKAALEDENPVIRRAATGNLTDQVLLARIAVEDEDEYVRSTAVEKLKDQVLLSEIAVKDSNPDVRATAAGNLTDQALLARIATEDGHAWVRRTAALKLTDQDTLAKIAMEDSDLSVRMIAAPKITDQTLLSKIALKSKDSNIRKSAVEKLTNQAVLAKVARQDEDIIIRIIAVNKLTDLSKDNESHEKFSSADFLAGMKDETEGGAAAWVGSRKGAYKKKTQSQTSLKYTAAVEKNALKTDDTGEKKETAAAVCRNDFCEKNENHSNCPADCFPEDIKPTGLSKGDKAVFLDFVYKGQKSGIYFVANKGVYEKLASLPRTLSHKEGKEFITKKDFILPRLNNRLQKEKLLPLVEKIKSLTPDVNKQARIAISMVQNIPYGFPTIGNSGINIEKKYPYGVIWEQVGICDEKSDLLLFLLRELGFGTAALIYRKEYHRAVGIKCPDPYDVDDSGYCYVEVTTPKIITDNLSRDTGIGTLTDFTLINISDGIQLEGVEEEFRDKNLYYDLILKAKSKNGVMEQDEYTLLNSILSKYGMK